VHGRSDHANLPKLPHRRKSLPIKGVIHVDSSMTPGARISAGHRDFEPQWSDGVSGRGKPLTRWARGQPLCSVQGPLRAVRDHVFELSCGNGDCGAPGGGRNRAWRDDWGACARKETTLGPLFNGAGPRAACRSRSEAHCARMRRRCRRFYGTCRIGSYPCFRHRWGAGDTVAQALQSAGPDSVRVNTAQASGPMF